MLACPVASAPSWKEVLRERHACPGVGAGAGERSQGCGCSLSKTRSKGIALDLRFSRCRCVSQNLAVSASAVVKVAWRRVVDRDRDCRPNDLVCEMPLGEHVTHDTRGEQTSFLSLDGLREGGRVWAMRP